MEDEARTRGGRRHYDPYIDEAVRGHNDDEYAHGAALHSIGTRMSNMEKWQQRTIGAVAMLSFLVVTVAGIVVVLIPAHLK